MNKYLDSEEEYERPIDFLGTFIKYLSYWKWFAASLLIFLSLGYIYLKFTLPTYEVSTSILLKDDQKGGGTAEINAFKEMGLFTQKNNVDNELEVLNKSILVEQVVHELGIYATYTQVGTLEFIKTLGINHNFPDLGTFDEKILYGAECPILVSLPDTVLNKMSSAYAFEILIHPYGEYEFSGVYNDQKFLVKASISDQQVKLPFGKINIVRGKYKPTEDMIVAVVLQNPLSILLTD